MYSSTCSDIVVDKKKKSYCDEEVMREINSQNMSMVQQSVADKMDINSFLKSIEVE